MKEYLAILVKAIDLHIYFEEGELHIETKISGVKLYKTQKEKMCCVSVDKTQHT